jgi:hypothetical protein
MPWWSYLVIGFGIGVGILWGTALLVSSAIHAVAEQEEAVWGDHTAPQDGEDGNIQKDTRSIA